MSDPNRKMDVEDVLSSIRRLVSEQARGGDDAADQPAVTPQNAKSGNDAAVLQPNDVAASQDDSADDKLVLTQSLRINGQPTDEDMTEAASRLAQRISDIDTLVSEAVADPAPEAPEETADAAATTDAAPVAADTAADEALVALPDADGPSDADRADAGEAPEPLQVQNPIDASPAGVLQSGKELRTEEATSPTAPPSPDPQPQQEADEEVAPAENIAAADLDYLDEDSLRELVAQLVRSELQGELGDRITRNVRKMVRREIQRAFSARELD